MKSLKNYVNESVFDVNTDTLKYEVGSKIFDGLYIIEKVKKGTMYINDNPEVPEGKRSFWCVISKQSQINQLIAAMEDLRVYKFFIHCPIIASNNNRVLDFGGFDLECNGGYLEGNGEIRNLNIVSHGTINCNENNPDNKLKVRNVSVNVLGEEDRLRDSEIQIKGDYIPPFTNLGVGKVMCNDYKNYEKETDEEVIKKLLGKIKRWDVKEITLFGGNYSKHRTINVKGMK